MYDTRKSPVLKKYNIDVSQIYFFSTSFILHTSLHVMTKIGKHEAQSIELLQHKKIAPRG